MFRIMKYYNGVIMNKCVENDSVVHSYGGVLSKNGLQIEILVQGARPIDKKPIQTIAQLIGYQYI